MIIKLKGYLDLDLTRIGLRPGDIIKGASIANELSGSVLFDHFYTIENQCIVWPDNYDVIKSDKPKKQIQFTIT